MLMIQEIGRFCQPVRSHARRAARGNPRQAGREADGAFSGPWSTARKQEAGDGGVRALARRPPRPFATRTGGRKAGGDGKRREGNLGLPSLTPSSPVTPLQQHGGAARRAPGEDVQRRGGGYSFSSSLAFLASSMIFCWIWAGTSSYWENSMVKVPRSAVMDLSVEA